MNIFVVPKYFFGRLLDVNMEKNGWIWGKYWINVGMDGYE
jgi:hypothetical protein